MKWFGCWIVEMPDPLKEAMREFEGLKPWLGGYEPRLEAFEEKKSQPIQKPRGEAMEPTEPVKPGWKTSEFYVAMGASVIGILVLLGWLTPAEQVTANQWIKALSDNIAGAAIVLGAVWRFIHSRTQVKAAAQTAKAAESNLLAANENRHAAEATARSMNSGMGSRAMALVLIGLFVFVGAASAADFNFIRVGGKYYLVNKTDPTQPNRLVTVAFFDIDGAPLPGPGPGPDPVVIPEGWNGLTKTVYTATLKVPVASRAKAKAFGDNFEAVASGIAAGQFTDINAANAELKAKNEATAGTTRETWLPVLTEEAKAMQALFVAGKFTGLEDYATAYHAIAEGFHLAASAKE